LAVIQVGAFRAQKLLVRWVLERSMHNFMKVLNKRKKYLHMPKAELCNIECFRGQHNFSNGSFVLIRYWLCTQAIIGTVFVQKVIDFSCVWWLKH